MATYRGKKVTLNKPVRTPGESKKFKVFVKDGNKVKIVRFGDPNMKIRKSNPLHGSHSEHGTTVITLVLRPKHATGCKNW